MKERPILFSGPMVAAILAGRKSQTRRVVKPQHRVLDIAISHDVVATAADICPFGRPGDRLWVRETWAVRGLAHGMKPSQAAKIASPDAWRYAADDTTGWQHGWKPSIHMPRAASRITLEITGVRCERLNDISEEDAIAEGVSYTGPYPCAVASGFLPRPADLARMEFRTLWESINGPRSWDANPWVWVVDFRRVEP